MRQRMFGGGTPLLRRCLARAGSAHTSAARRRRHSDRSAKERPFLRKVLSPVNEASPPAAPSASAVKPRLPRGLADRGPDEIAATARMIAAITSVYELYGFEPVETPMLEYTDVLGKFLPDQDRPNEGVFSLRDDDEQWLSLRYDLTAPLARLRGGKFRAAAEALPELPGGHGVPQRESRGPGRFRQFTQFDADTVGAAGVAADAEMCMMAADCMERLGIARGDLRHQGQQPQGSGRPHGGAGSRRHRECRTPPGGAAGRRQARSAGTPTPSSSC